MFKDSESNVFLNWPSETQKPKRNVLYMIFCSYYIAHINFTLHVHYVINVLKHFVPLKSRSSFLLQIQGDSTL